MNHQRIKPNLRTMSDHRRSSSRKRGTKQFQIPSNAPRPARKPTKQSPSDSSLLNRRSRSPNIPTSSVIGTTNKRTRLDSVTSKKSNQKKKREILYDDNDEVEEILSETKSIEKKEMDRCAICLDDCTEPKQLDKCSHVFCTDCIDHYFRAVKPQCPCCFTIYGEIRGNQPINGTMTIDTVKHRLPGFEHDSRGSIRITYHFPDDIQDESHPNPGMPYHGTTRQAFLPENRDGRHVLGLLQKAFQLRQIFTVGQSRTTGYDNVVTWNDIHHKTSVHGGVENFGYPDKTYLSRVKQELAAKGIK